MVIKEYDPFLSLTDYLHPCINSKRCWMGFVGVVGLIPMVP